MIMLPTKSYNFSINSRNKSCITFWNVPVYTNPTSFLLMISFFAVFEPSTIHDLRFASCANNMRQSVQKHIWNKFKTLSIITFKIIHLSKNIFLLFWSPNLPTNSYNVNAIFFYDSPQLSSKFKILSKMLPYSSDKSKELIDGFSNPALETEPINKKIWRNQSVFQIFR